MSNLILSAVDGTPFLEVTCPEIRFKIVSTNLQHICQVAPKNILVKNIQHNFTLYNLEWLVLNFKPLQDLNREFVVSDYKWSKLSQCLERGNEGL